MKSHNTVVCCHRSVSSADNQKSILERHTGGVALVYQGIANICFIKIIIYLRLSPLTTVYLTSGFHKCQRTVREGCANLGRQRIQGISGQQRLHGSSGRRSGPGVRLPVETLWSGIQ